MRIAARIALLAAAALLTTAAAAPAKQTVPARLVAFRSCGDLLGYVKGRAAGLVGPYGLGAPLAHGGGVVPVTAPAAPARAPGVDYSATNVQEAGVDEPDIVKTDGTTLFAVGNGMLNAVDVTGARPRLLDSVKLAPGLSHELLLDGDRLLVLSRSGAWLAPPLPAAARAVVPFAPTTTVLTAVDVSSPKALRVMRTLTIDGSYVAARQVGASTRVVVSSQLPGELPFVSPTDATQGAIDAARDANRRVVQGSGLRSWLPTYRLGASGTPHPLVQCRKVRRPQAFAGLGMLTVLTLDFAKSLDPVSSVGVMTDGRIVYASTDDLYVATERWAVRPLPTAPETPIADASTTIHRFEIANPSRTEYRGSGTVPGYLLSQWSLSEYRGVLRVVSTETPAWWGSGRESESFLTTLRPSGGALVQAGRVGGLGKGERVYAVRFVGDAGYVVTFRQIDPLHTLDLSDPDRPRLVGELSLPGYSSYLHPVGPGLLLGIGQDVDDGGHPLGTQLSLFDVSDLRHPARVAHAALGAGWSEAESDHHAFLFWPKSGLVVVPFVRSAVGYRVSKSGGIDHVGEVEQQNAGSIRRSVVVGPSVFTVSDGGVASSALSSLAPQGWAAFPRPDASPPRGAVSP